MNRLNRASEKPWQLRQEIVECLLLQRLGPLLHSVTCGPFLVGASLRMI